MSHALEIRLLGPLEVRLDDTVVDLGGDQQRLVLARLALSAGRPVVRSELIDVLWLDVPPDNAVGNLQSYVSRLRSRLGAEHIVTVPAGYQLEVPSDAIDAVRVEAALAASARPDERYRILSGVVDLWRGPSLGELAERGPLIGAAHRLDELRLRVLAAWAQAALSVGAVDDVATRLGAEIATGCDRTQLHLLHIEALGRAGRTADALRAAHEHRTALVEGTGLDAGSALAAMERRLLAGELERAEDASPARLSVTRFSPTDRLVGRSAELRQLDAATRASSLVTITGTGGLGKTRLLLRHLDDVAPTRSVHLVRLGTLPPGADAVAAIAGSLELVAAGPDLVGAIVDRLDQGMLLALDGAEHVLDTVRPLIETLMARRSDLTVVASSRRRLGLPGERLFELGPLARDPELVRRVGEVDGFVPFTQAELVVEVDQLAALELLDGARARCAAAGHDYNRRVAEIARLAVLVRLRDPAAASAARDVLDECRSAGMWPQVWMIVRHVAELLAAAGQEHDAAVLLAAADVAPDSSAVTGADADRLAELRRRLNDVLGHDGVAAAAAEGASLSRLDAVRRAHATLAPSVAPGEHRHPARTRQPSSKPNGLGSPT